MFLKRLVISSKLQVTSCKFLQKTCNLLLVTCYPKRPFHSLLFTVFFLWLYACTPTPPPLSQHPLKSHTTTDTVPNPVRYLLFGSGKKAADKSDSLSLAELKLLQKGDILLRKGYGAISDYIADFLQEQYPVTHCGFVVQDGDSLAILHTISTDAHNGMLVEPLSSYLRQSQVGTVVAVRLKTDVPKIEKALHLAQLLVAQKIPFDMGFDDKNASSLYCLEMVRNVLKEVFQKDILTKRQTKQGVDVLSMDNFFDTTYFDVMFNHFDNKQVTNK